MKKQIITISLMLTGVLAFSQNCILGNAVTKDFETDIFYPNYLLGGKYTLEESKTLNAIKLIGNGTGAKAQMALYDDYNGKPHHLLVATKTARVTASVVKFEVSPIVLEAGDYWVMAVYDQPGNHTYINFDAIENEVYYSPLTFGEEIPVDASEFRLFKGQDYTHFLSFDCSSNSSEEEEGILLVPNPATRTITLTNLKKTSFVQIISHFQIPYFSSEVSPESNTINIESYPAGIYFLTINSSKHLIFMKE